jgi:HEAT repeat protein
MMRSLAFALVLGLAAPASAQLVPDEPAPFEVERARELGRQLVLIEGEVPAAWVRGLTPADRAVLRGLAEDRVQPVVVRRRAVLALRHLPEPAVRALLVRRAEDPAEDPIVSRYALRALALAFGASAFDAIAARLDDARAQVRDGAAEALVLADRSRARPALSVALAAETTTFVRRTLERLLAE